ncbi:MAG: 5'-nucleotidase, partial [Oscillospiraceae bacterium]
TPEDAQWFADYNAGRGSFAEHCGPALETFQTLIDAGILRKEDRKVYYQDRERMLFTRQCAMVEDSVLMARMGYAMTGTIDEFGLMPFFNPGPDGDWARLYPVCYIGVDKRLAEPKNAAKYELVMRLLEYISTPEGQTALAGDTGAMFSSLNGTEPPDVPEIADLRATLNHGRYTVFPTLRHAQDALRRGLAGMVEGRLTAADVSKMVDAENASPPEAEPLEVLGTAERDFTMIETGNLITDAMRAQSGCEIALFMDNGKDGKYNGKGVSARLYQGDVTALDLRRIFPDLKHGETGELWKVTMSGKDLIRTLEYSIPVDNDRDGWFYYFSGLRMTYAPAAEPGTRIRSITDAKGGAIQPDRSYSVAVMEDSVLQDAIQTCEKTGVLIQTLLEETIRKAKTISPDGDGRFTVC